MTRHIFQQVYNVTTEEIKLLINKLPFPYEHANFKTIYISNNELPPPEVFYNKLKNSEVDSKEYANACKVYKVFKCGSLADYLKLYNLLDVALLSDIWTNHRNTCRKIFGVDCTNYVSISSMSFQVGLQKSKAILDFIQLIALYTVGKKAQIGGIVNVSHRYSEANIPGFPGYDPKKPIKYIVQLDINGLYSYIMLTFPLPVGNFQQCTAEFVKNFKPENYDIHGATGYLIECDIDFEGTIEFDGKQIPVHDYLRDLPPFPEKVKLNFNDLSETSKEFQRENPDLPNNNGKELLLCSLYPKKR